MPSSSVKRLNLSQPEIEKKNYLIKNSIALVVSQWNKSITGSMAEGAVAYLKNYGMNRIEQVEVPGSYELPLAAWWLAQKTHIDAVICIGCLIKGQTPHFDFISQAVAHGLMEVSLKSNKPVVFGVLTTLTMEQALERSGGVHGNKGVEAAITCLEMLELKYKLLK